MIESVLGTLTNYAIIIQENSGDVNISYIGIAPIGSATSAAVWQIKELDETTGAVITWCDGNDSFDNIWDNREGLTYS